MTDKILPLNTRVRTPRGLGTITEVRMDLKLYKIFMDYGELHYFGFNKVKAADGKVSILVDTSDGMEETPTKKDATDLKNEPKIRITSDGRWSNTYIMIGDQHLRVDKLNISYDGSRDRSNRLKVELEVYMPEIDIEALQRDTQLTVKKY